MPRPRKNRISIIWDFDKTLTQSDSTSIVVEYLTGGNSNEFWNEVKKLTDDKRKISKKNWKYILSSHAPAWMHVLGNIATNENIPLNKEFFNKEIKKHIDLYPKVEFCLKQIKKIQNRKNFKNEKIEIHHFIVSAGLKELVDCMFSKSIITETFGCIYKPVNFIGHDGKIYPDNIPVFCMDQTMKTRSIFEIHKGSFKDPSKQINDRVEEDKTWSPFSNIIYIGDGDTDIPALSLVRKMGGIGIVVYKKHKSIKEKKKVIKSLKIMSAGKRADLITPADFSTTGELFKYIEHRCIQICSRYEVSNIKNKILSN